LINSSDGQIVQFGPSLQRGESANSEPVHLETYFEIIRPRDTALDLDVASKSNKPHVLKRKSDGLTLRGLFFSIGPELIAFVGSILIASSNTLNEYDLSISDFAAVDPSPDIIILHRFREIQLKDQQKQIAQLKSLIEARDRFDRYANTDELTGIANRRMFWRKGSEIINNLNKNHLLVILLFDLDGFKNINDTFGHDLGDKVLQEVAKRCESAANRNDLVARLGGDEFVILCSACDIRGIEQLTDRLIYELQKPINYGDRQLSIYASIGASFVSKQQSIDDAIRCADLAMYQGRKENNVPVSWFTPTMRAMQNYRNSIQSSLEKAIEEREIAPYFQPIIDLQNCSLHGFEALARWQHPEHGLVYPDVFIEVAAESDCLHKLDFLILESALDQLAIWNNCGKNYSIHVNLSGTSIRSGVQNIVVDLLEKRNLSPDVLVLELTETTLLNTGNEVKQVLQQLAEYGIAIQLDDFGTGYSSLTHLHDLPINGVKIDRSFLFDYPDDSRSIALIETVMDIASRLGLEVVTEGIETDLQSNWITSIGSRFGQGYLYGKPSLAGTCEDSALDWITRYKNAA
jgi:diguanylate cyclase (GGDEF)-like protein